MNGWVACTAIWIAALAPAAAIAIEMGDANCDGRIDTRDLTATIRILFGGTSACAGSDSNGDRRVTASDLVAVMQRLALATATASPTSSSTASTVSPTATVNPSLTSSVTPTM